MRVSFRTACPVMISLIAAAMSYAQAGGDFEVTAFSIDSGGGTSVGGPFELVSLVGEPADGELAGGEFEVVGGVVIEIPPGDCDEDGDVDLADFLVFQECFTGPVGRPFEPMCRCSDVDGDGTIDLADFVAFQAAFTGSR